MEKKNEYETGKLFIKNISKFSKEIALPFHQFVRS